jgi:hypothetical protein
MSKVHSQVQAAGLQGQILGSLERGPSSSTNDEDHDFHLPDGVVVAGCEWSSATVCDQRVKYHCHIPVQRMTLILSQALYLSLSLSLSLPRLEAALAVVDGARWSYRYSARPFGVATSDDRTGQTLTAHSLLVIVM